MNAKEIADEVGWLIEATSMQPVQWWCAGPHENFSPNAAEAVRFARKDDAEKVMEWLNLGIGGGTFEATEHLWWGGKP